MKKEDYKELTYLINGCAIEVHKKLGPGFQEVIYQRALEIEFSIVNINFVREKEHDIYYNEIVIGTRRADFVIEDKIVVELKATTETLKVHLAQAKNYLSAYNKPIGLLINFGTPSLTFNRIYRKNSSYLRKIKPS